MKNQIHFTATLVFTALLSLWSLQNLLAQGGKPSCPVASAIDLGLPSGTKWASWNIGASAPEEFGGYYAWAETVEKDGYYPKNYAYYEELDFGNYIDFERKDIGDDIAGTQYDVAHVKWGGNWRMPTHKQIIELIDECSFTLTRRNGIRGYLVKGPNGNSIFLPAAGYRIEDKTYAEGTKRIHYWSSSVYGYVESNGYTGIPFLDQLYSDKLLLAKGSKKGVFTLSISSEGEFVRYETVICNYGCPVRAVCE